jgi:hypothetical protein
MLGKKPVEIAGFDMNTKQMIFHAAFGGPEDIAGAFAIRSFYED